ncbi:MAG: metallophosphoesterase [Planctomycetaceae bacterium]|nr:metallophosphoesterase [Planctomycetaceae bacterium]MCA9111270.1 metallophosphoesterase [Planctomycetaceae bacterium]
MKLATHIDGPVAVIGDVHGQVDQLEDVLEKLNYLPDLDERWIVFIGDLVDRGPDPMGAIEILLDLIEDHPRTTCVSGNHEFAMAAALELIPTPSFTDWPEEWVELYGADTTFDSYGAEFGDLNDLYEKMPEVHRLLLQELPWCVEHPRYLFVHAGIDPNQPFDLQMQILHERDFSLARPPWLCSKAYVNSGVPDDCPLTVVSGHVPVSAVHFGDRRLLIDTTGGVQGELSCVLLPENIIVTSGDEPPPPPTRPAPAKRSGLFGFFK